jgi:hypothetical protein
MDDFRTMRLNPVSGAQPAPEAVDLGGLESVTPPPGLDTVMTMELPDGGVSINFSPVQKEVDAEAASDHDENLALHVDSGELVGVADTLMRLVKDDITRQEERLKDIVTGIDLLGVKLEQPKDEPGMEGISVVHHPLLLEAVMRFQAGCRGELLPSDGPVKVDNEGDQTQEIAKQAQALEQDFNFYLTTGAPEYYPDTDRMFFSLGLGGEAYKKVYYHPLKQRPVSETIDRKDIILSDGAVSIESCARVTHRSKMKPSDVKRLQIAGAWRDVHLSSNYMSLGNPVEITLQEVSGVSPKTSIEPEETDREIWEIYCELNLKGFENKDGLPLPYRVTIDKESREVLDIRRWWDEDDEFYIRKEVFVEYIFVPAFPGVNLGLLHILGNAARALTAAWRIALDNGMLANFPGSVMARSTGRQQTTTIRVGPGQVAPLDVDGVPLNQAFMPLPYRDVTQGFMNIMQNVEQTAQRLGGTAELQVGEGRQDAPVGTTIAMIDQAQKTLSAVHKRLHNSQQKEFALLRELFKIYPESLWRSNRNPNFQKDATTLQAALENYSIVPKADPNTSSQTLRIQKAIALKTLAQQSPMMYDMRAIDQRIMEMIGVEDFEGLFSKAMPPTAPPVDPVRMMEAQAKMMDANTKAQEVQVKRAATAMDATTKIALGKAQIQDIQTKAMKAQTDAANHAADRRSKLQLEAMKLQQTELVHRDKILQTDKHKMADILHQEGQSAQQRAYDMQTGEADRIAQAGLASLKTKAPDNV